MNCTRIAHSMCRPLYADQKKSLTAAPSLSYCSRKMWMVMDGGKVVGRICGMINPRYNERYGKKRVRFGWFDTIDDLEVARLLIGTAEAWARENGMDEIHGPLYYKHSREAGDACRGLRERTSVQLPVQLPRTTMTCFLKLGFSKECGLGPVQVACRPGTSGEDGDGG